MLAGLNEPGWCMNVGKTLFAQVMEFVPWKTFSRIIERHDGDAGVRTLGCADLFRVMAFSQRVCRILCKRTINRRRKPAFNRRRKPACP
jgi:hypothetical protein